MTPAARNPAPWSRARQSVFTTCAICVGALILLSVIRPNGKAWQHIGEFLFVAAAITFMLSLAVSISLGIASRVIDARRRHEALLDLLAQPGRAHLLLKPPAHLVAAGVFKLAVSGLLQALAVMSLRMPHLEPAFGQFMAALAIGMGLTLLIRGMRNTCDYLLMREAWREAGERYGRT